MENKQNGTYYEYNNVTYFVYNTTRNNFNLCHFMLTDLAVTLKVPGPKHAFSKIEH